MELRNNQSAQRRLGARAAQAGAERVRAQITNAREAQEAALRSTIERVDQATRRDEAQLRRAASGAGDTVEFSELAARVAEQDELQAQRREQVAELRRQHDQGTLNDRQRIERAAEGLLGDR